LSPDSSSSSRQGLRKAPSKLARNGKDRLIANAAQPIESSDR
jgi:hypothetical protein